jgi:hypothetical protein
METHPKLTVQYTLRRTKVYDPFQYSWRTVICWVIVVFLSTTLVPSGSRRIWELWYNQHW